jgi:hypothetical protein
MAARSLLPALPAGPFVIRLYRCSWSGSRETFSVLYCGEERYSREFAFMWSGAQTALSGAETMFSGNLLKYGLAPGIQGDVVLRQRFPGMRAAAGEFPHRPFLDAILELAPTLEEQIARVRSKAHRRRLRAQRRTRKYTARLSRDMRDFDLFYDSMYAPYVRAKFGERSRVDSREELGGLFQRAGHLLLVSEGTEPVCGTLLFPRASTLCYHRNGFAGGADWPARLLAERTAALELSLLEHAIGSGFRSLDLGFTRAVLSDGLYVHKRRLGCSFSVASYSPAFLVKIRPAAASRFLAAFPLLAATRRGFAAHLGHAPGEAPKPARRWKRVVKNYAFPGLAEAVLHTDVGPIDPGRVEYETALRRAMGDIPLRIAQSPDW